MFLGIDHGTTAIRFATENGRCWELPRHEASRLSSEEILAGARSHLGLTQVDLVVLTYSMGDGLVRIVRLQDAPTGHCTAGWRRAAYRRRHQGL